MEGIEKKEIDWKWRKDKESEYDGKYEGQMENGRPHGLGRWKGVVYDLAEGDTTVEGEWKNGQLHGKVVVNWSDGDCQEYEAKDGKMHGK